MADRTKPERASIEVTPEVKEQVKQHKADLLRVLNRRNTVGEIVAAWVAGVPLWETAAMLDAYRPKEDSEESESSSGSGE